jgi:hypothetical protein
MTFSKEGDLELGIFHVEGYIHLFWVFIFLLYLYKWTTTIGNNFDSSQKVHS